MGGPGALPAERVDGAAGMPVAGSR
jgi:hypothetical protein